MNRTKKKKDTNKTSARNQKEETIRHPDKEQTKNILSTTIHF